MNTTELYVGSVVRIYEDPLTMEEPEGLAELIKKTGETNECEIWEVLFISDEFGAGPRIRKIAKGGE